MSYKLKCIMGLIVVILCCSCCEYKNTNGRKGTNEYSMELSQEKSFFLDSTTSQEVKYMQLLGDTSLAIFNPPMNNICFFDWATGKERMKINLHKEGPHAVKGIVGFYFQSKDSVWLYDYWRKELYLADFEGNIKERRSLKDLLYPIAKQPYSVYPYPQTSTPFKKVDNKFILSGMDGIISDASDGVLPAATVLYDWNTNKLETKNPYPSVYDNKDKMSAWHAFAYKQVPYTLNDKREMVFSFPASDSIVVYSIDKDSYSSFFAGYSEETHIKPHVSTSEIDSHRNYLEQYQYSSILYDSYRNLYYRLVVLPKMDYDLNDPATQQKDLAVIILNKNFEKVGEYQLEHERYYYGHSFVVPDGLCINVVSDDDDYLKFKVLKAIKNEK